MEWGGGWGQGDNSLFLKPSLYRTRVQLANLNHTHYTAGIARYVVFISSTQENNVSNTFEINLSFVCIIKVRVFKN